MRKFRVWFKGVLKRFIIIPGYCKKCGANMRDFRVDPEIWFMVESETKYMDLCFNCFYDVCSQLKHLIDFDGAWYLIPGPIERGRVLCKLQIAKDPDDGVCPLYSGCVDGYGKKRIVNIAESRIVFSHPVTEG